MCNEDLVGKHRHEGELGLGKDSPFPAAPAPPGTPCCFLTLNAHPRIQGSDGIRFKFRDCDLVSPERPETTREDLLSRKKQVNSKKVENTDLLTFRRR